MMRKPISPGSGGASSRLPVLLRPRRASARAQSYSTSTDASGYFTLTTGLADGTYTWLMKGQRNLANFGSLTVQNGGSSPEMGTLRAGDANNDNVTSVQDFNILRATFGKAQGDPGYDARADFNGDISISITDFNLLRGNFGLGGAVLTCP